MEEEVTYSIEDNFLEIPELGFFGQCHVSDNGKFALGWADKVFCIELGVRINYLDIPTAHEGKIANNGNFVIASNMPREGLSCVLNAYTPSCSIIVQKRVLALLFNNGISPSGDYAIWQTCNNPDSDVGNKLFFIDLINKRTAWAIPPEPGRADDYEFDDEKRILRLIYRAGQSYKYNYDGKFLDAEKLETNLLTSDLSYEVLWAVEDKLKSKSVTASDYPKLIEYLEAALKKRPEALTESSIYRRLGEMHYELGDFPLGKKEFENALRLNPKVGVKRILAKINKELN